MAITGDEGRGSLRKAAGSWQTSIDPQISEWGNPALSKWLSLKAIGRTDEQFVCVANGENHLLRVTPS